MFRYSSPGDSKRISFAGEYKNGILRISAARTSEKDHFVRKIGRTIAKGRLEKGITVHEERIEDFTARKFSVICDSLISKIHKEDEQRRYKNARQLVY